MAVDHDKAMAVLAELNTFDFSAVYADRSACQPLPRRGDLKGH
jgi:hypothetical protein